MGYREEEEEGCRVCFTWKSSCQLKFPTQEATVSKKRR